MKIACERASVLRAVELASLVVPTRSTVPAFQMLLFTAEPGVMTVSGTDGETFIRHTVTDIECGDVWAALLPAQQLKDVLAQMPDDQFVIETTDAGIVNLMGMSDEYELPTGDAHDFPNCPETPEYMFSVPSQQLRVAIKQTAFAAGEESTKYALTGVQFKADNQSLTLAATDSRRGSVRSIAIDSAITEPKAEIVPTKAVKSLDWLLEQQSNVMLGFTAHHFCAMTDFTMISTRVLQGRFPPLYDLMRAKTTQEITFPAADLLSAVKRASVMVDQETSRMTFSLTGKGEMLLYSQSAVKGKSKVKIPFDYSGPAFEVAFNPKFLTDFLRVAGGESVSWRFSDPAHPSFFHCGSWVHLIMPLT